VNSLVDEVERLGESAEHREMTKREAAHKLKESYPNFTIPGCYELISNWRDVRKHYGLPGPYPEPAST
jgi:hypothetical protein